MGRAPTHKTVRYGPKESYRPVRCGRQFPDCPEQPNEASCRLCPLWKH
ncbi:MAG: hypothetical protein V1702_01710 [Candidatus Woesearchaeota archaeon]